MPTYEEVEQSEHDGAPIELYKFFVDSQIYRLTSWLDNVTIPDGTYTPVAGLKRSKIITGDGEKSSNVQVELPINAQLVTDTAFVVPPATFELTIFRLHDSGSIIEFWKGPVVSHNVKGRKCVYKVESTLGEILNSTIPNVVIQPLCNHELYDDRCTVNSESASFKVSTTIDSIIDSVNFVVDSVGGASAGFFKSGKLTNSATNEVRMITAQSGNNITVTYPFRQLAAGDSIDIRAGCDHTKSTCRSKFSNAINFGGDPWIPNQNVFQEGVK